MACKLLGYADGVYAGNAPRRNISQLEQPIWLDDVRCRADVPSHRVDNPRSLLDCNHAGQGLNNCDHSEDVKVRCFSAPVADGSGPGEDPPGLSVADATVEEAVGAAADFVVTLSRAASEAVTVDYATSDGTATAGSDYTETSGTLTFAPGDLSETVSVPVLADGVDEMDETFTLTLGNPSGGDAYLADDAATGTIESDDPMPRAWMARFGRKVASQAVDAIGARMRGEGAHVNIGGQKLDPAGGDAARGEGKGPVPGADRLAWTDGEGRTRSLTVRELLLGSSFQLSTRARAGAPRWTGWGRLASGRFDAAEDGVRMDGSVTSGFLGADLSRRRWLAGVALGFSEGEGGFSLIQGSDRGAVESTLTAVYPYARVGVNERVDVWGLAGYGRGELTLTQHADADRTRNETVKTDIAMRLGAAGVRGEVLSPSAGRGLSVAVRSDAFWVRTSSAAVDEGRVSLEASEADVVRLRLLLEGSRPFRAGGGTLTPSLELGLRHDDGDAETGTGLEVGARLGYTGGGVTVDGSVRTLVAHESSSFENWGAAGTLRIDPDPSGRGVSLTVSPTWGAASSGVERLWSLASTRGLAHEDGFTAGRRLEAELGYGFDLGLAPGVLVPYAGLSLVERGKRSWRLGTRWRIAPETTLGLEATRTEARPGGGEPAYGVDSRFRARW